MKKTFLSVALALSGLLMSTGAWADGNHTISLQSERADWATSSQTFPISEIAEELGTDSETLYNSIINWKNAGYAGDLFALRLPDGTWQTAHGTAGDGAFYIAEDGSFLDGWSDAAGYARLDFDENDITITIGQTGRVVKGDIVSTCAINLNGQQVVFNNTLSIVVPEIDKTPVTVISDLEIVGTTTYQLVQTPNNDYYNEPNTVSLKGICEQLGIDSQYMQDHLRPMLYAKQYKDDVWQQELVNDFTATPSPGFWFNSGVWDEVTQEELDECTHGGWVGNETNRFWVASIAFNGEDETLDCTIGQFPGWALKEHHTADIYIVYGNKAHVITFDLTVDIEDGDKIDNYKSVGSESITINRDPRGGWTELDRTLVNSEAILAAFGEEITMDDLTLYGTDQYGNLTSSYTADAPGFWLTMDGSVTGYTSGTLSFFVNLVTETDSVTTDSINYEYTYSKYLDLGNMINVFKGGETGNAKLYLIYGDKSYTLDINVGMKSPEYTIETCEITEKSLTVKLVPSAGVWQVGTTDVSFIEDIIGTATGKFYGVKQGDEGEYLSDEYSVGECEGGNKGGGFWMSAPDSEGMAYAAGYSGDGAYAIWYYDNTITWYAVPGLPQPGDIRYGTFYIANFWEGKAVKLNVKIKFVDSTEQTQLVGKEYITMSGKDDDGDYSYLLPDLTSCAQALGCNEEDLAYAEWYVLDNEEEKYIENYSDPYGYYLDANGYPTEELDSIRFAVGFFDGELHACTFDDSDEEIAYHTVLYVTYDGKAYAFDMTVINSSANAIQAVTATVSDNTAYDLSGMKANLTTKGIVIRSGKKILVK